MLGCTRDIFGRMAQVAGNIVGSAVLDECRQASSFYVRKLKCLTRHPRAAVVVAYFNRQPKDESREYSLRVVGAGVRNLPYVAFPLYKKKQLAACKLPAEGRYLTVRLVPDGAQLTRSQRRGPVFNKPRTPFRVGYTPCSRPETPRGHRDHTRTPRAYRRCLNRQQPQALCALFAPCLQKSLAGS